MSIELPTATVSEHGRLRHIDALRAIAALLVVWRHVADAFVGLGPQVSGRWIAEWGGLLDVGRIGVVTFFLISGYVIPFSIDARRPAPIAGFLIKRFFRIYPAYWLSIPLGAATGYWLWGREFGWREILVNLTLLQDFLGVAAAQGLYWTLLVEWSFYLLCVLLFLARSLGSNVRLLMLAWGLTAIYSFEILVHWWTGASLLGIELALWCLNLAMMLIGTLYRRLIVERAQASSRLQAGYRCLLGWHLVLLPCVVSAAIGIKGNATVSYALGLAVFMLGMSWLQLRLPLLDWLGRISYSIYLFHPVVFMSLLWAMQWLPADSPLRALHLGVYLLVCTVLAILLADLVYRSVERPGIALGRRWAKAWAARAGSAAPTAAEP